MYALGGRMYSDQGGRMYVDNLLFQQVFYRLVHITPIWSENRSGIAVNKKRPVWAYFFPSLNGIGGGDGYSNIPPVTLSTFACG